MSQLIVPFPVTPAKHSGIERRAWVRYPCSFEASCHAVASVRDVLWSATVRDISAGGIGLLVSRRFEPGTVLRVEVHYAIEDTPLTVLARVMHATAQPAGEWALGCAFARELEDEDLRAFNAERARPARSDCRAWIRFPCNVDTTCSPVGEAAQERWPATVLNISASGVGLRVNREFEPKTILSIELPRGNAQDSQTVLARVAHATHQADGDWVLGCAFISELSDEELQALL